MVLLIVQVNVSRYLLMLLGRCESRSVQPRFGPVSYFPSPPSRYTRPPSDLAS